MRSVSASRGRWTPGRSVSTSCHVAGPGGDAADRAAGGLRLVGDDRDLLAHERVDERRLADVGPARERDEARAGHLTQETISACRASISPLVGLVIHADQVQRAVDDGLARCPRCARGRSRRRRARAAPAGPASRVRRPGRRGRRSGPRSPRWAGVERGDPLGVDELDREVARRRCPADASAIATRRCSDSSGSSGAADDLDVEHCYEVRRRGCCAGRSSGAARWECSS